MMRMIRTTTTKTTTRLLARNKKSVPVLLRNQTGTGLTVNHSSPLSTTSTFAQSLNSRRMIAATTTTTTTTTTLRSFSSLRITEKAKEAENERTIKFKLPNNWMTSSLSSSSSSSSFQVNQLQQLQYQYQYSPASLPMLMLVRRDFSTAPNTTSTSTSTSTSTNDGSTATTTASSFQYSSSSSTTSTSNTNAPPPPQQLKPPMPRKIGRVQIPTPTSALPPEHHSTFGFLTKYLQQSPRQIALFTWNTTRTILLTLWKALTKLPYWTWYYVRHPVERKERWNALKEAARHEAQHYWHGTKLLVADVRTARQLMQKTLHGNALTRRERKQLLRTVSDLFRLVPFSMFIIIPFMEFALPFALRLFPNLLPSTFQDSLKAEENMKRELQSRIAMAQFFQETLETLAKEQKKKAVRRRQELEQQSQQEENQPSTTADDTTTTADDTTTTKSTTTTTEDNSTTSGFEKNQEDSAASMLEFLAKARNGEMIPPEVIIRYANYFQDDLTLDNMPRMQLINMCRYMSIPPYGSDSFLRFQLRHKIRSLKEDDQRILWEGIDSLTKMELREAVQERGMRSTGLSKDAYKRALQQWLDLSVNKNVPIALLIMSRTFFLQDEITPPPPTAVAAAAEAIKTDSKVDAAFTAKKDTSLSTKDAMDASKKDAKATDAAAASKTSDGKDKSATATTTTSSSLTGLADAISGLDQEVLNEVILELATKEEKTSDPEIRKLKLAVLEKQNELIQKEQQERQDAKKQQQQQQQQQQQAASKEMSSKQQQQQKQEGAAVSEAAAVEHDLMSTEAMMASAKEDTTESGKTTASSGAPSASSTAASTTSTDSFEGSLTTEEMDALRTILTDDPVSTEREALEKIKAAMNKDDMPSDEREELQRLRESIESHRGKAQKVVLATPADVTGAAASTAPMTPEEADAYVAEQVKEQDLAAAAAAAPAQAQTTFQSEGTEVSHKEMEEEEPEDPIVARLKKRVESMVDKIELQLSETQVKIGDKMHFLDKDRDGILSREEVAEVLQQVLKKKISFEEAMEIASEMDDNHDGIFTVDELLRWIDKHSLVRFVEEGRDVDLDKLVGSHATEAAAKDTGDSTNPK